MFVSSSTGFKIPTIGLGTSGFSSEVDLEKAIDAALEAGYRHIDTAAVYRNEKVVGRTLQKWLRSGKLNREDLFITTKLPPTGLHPELVEGFLKYSLENLQLDYVDLYLIHFPVALANHGIDPVTKYDDKGFVKLGPKTDHAAVWKKLEEQVDRGRARHIGLSNYTASQIQTVLDAARIKPANLQIELHVFLQQRDLIQFCHKNDITVVAFSPLGSPNFNERMKNFKKDFKPKALPDILGDDTVNKIARKHSKTSAQVMLRFLIQLGVAAIPKSCTPERIRSNLQVFDFVLDDEDMSLLKKLEVGESARITRFDPLKGAEQHPDYPYPKF